LFIVLRAQIVRTILGAGDFDWDATRLTAAALALFVVSLVGQNLVTLFIRAYYAKGSTTKPLVINLMSAVIIVVLSIIFVQVFQNFAVFRYFIESILKVPDIPGTEVLMLPLAFSVGTLLNLLIYWVMFSREFRGFSAMVRRTWMQVFSSSVIMGFVTYLSLNFFVSVFNINTLTGIFLQGLLSGIVGIVSAVLVLAMLKNREIAEVWKALHSKIWKVKVSVPDAELQ
jgi:peptidoglycan biosynthesis protein MviN/MurJ (putative lipid II flippase)